MQSAAQAWLLYRLTGSALLLGLAAFAMQVPVLLLSPVGGAVADKISRHRILLFTQGVGMLSALALALLTLTGLIQVWHIFIFAVLLGMVSAFDIPARQAFVIELVGKADLLNAIALNSSVFNGARIVGPAIAGLVIASVGEGWCFLANGVSYLAVIAGLLLMTITPHVNVATRLSAFDHLIEGFHFVWRHRPIRALLLLLGLVSLVGMPYTVLMPVFVDRILQGGPQELGLLISASGLGALVGALSLAARKDVHGLGRWVALASTGFGVSLILFSLSHSIWVSAALLVPVGFFMIVQMAASNTLIQVMVPDHLRGRVMAVYTMMVMGMATFGGLYAGSLAQQLGAPVTMAIGGVACIVGSALFGSRLPILRNEARQFIVSQNMAAGNPPDEVIGNNIRP